MISTVTSTFLGQGQIHYQGFTDTYEVEKIIANGKQVLEELDTENIISSYSPRSICFAMISSAENVSSILLYGIDPIKEAEVSKLDEAIIMGKYLANNDHRKIIIGRKLADLLEVDIGDKIVITSAQIYTGELTQEMFRIGGIFAFNVREMDGGMAFIPIEKAQKMLNLDDGFHEIALQFSDIELSGDRNLTFWKKYSKNGNVALGWNDIMTQLEAILQMSQFSIFITSFILFAVVSLGIMNTLFMSLYERMFEFGVLRAVGTRAYRMALLVLFEAAVLAMLSIIIGNIVGAVVTGLIGAYGIDYSGLEFAGVTFREPIKPVLMAYQFIKYPIYLFLFTIIIALYPAIFAAKITPARAMRRSM